MWDLGGTLRRLARVTSDLSVTVDRDAVAMGDDMVDNSRTYALAEPTVGELVAAVRDRAPWVHVVGAPTTWVLRGPGRQGPPLAVLQLDSDRGVLDVRPVADPSTPVARDEGFHLEYLTTQPVGRTLELIAQGARSLRDPQA